MPARSRVPRPLSGAGAALWLTAVACGLAPTYLPAPEAGPAPLRADAALGWGSTEGAPCVPDVGAALSRLGPRATALGFHLEGGAPIGGLRRHWQGVQRVGFGDARYLFVSRSGGTAAALVVRLESRPADGGRLSRDTNAAIPPEEDRVVASIPLDSGYTHAGGLALVGRVLAIPMDGGGRSEVVFYDVMEPAAPRRLSALDHSQARPPSTPRDVSAVGIVRLADGRYLLVLGVRSSKIIEFYRSRGTSLLDPALAFQPLGLLERLDVGGFQSLTLLAQCDGSLYLAGTHNTAIPPPSLGRDHVHWYRLRRGPDALPRLEKGGERWVHCERCNFGAGAGLFLSREGEVLLYATGFGSHEGEGWAIVEEFAPGPVSASSTHAVDAP